MTITANYPSIRPSLLLDFANEKALDSRITFTRASTATNYDGKTTVVAEQNLLTYSEQFDNAAWSGGSNTVITANSTTAPDGTTTADTFTDNTTNGLHWKAEGFTSVVGTTYTFSCYGKNLDGQYLNLSFFNGAATYGAAIYDLSAGTVASSGAVGSGWSVTSTSITSVGSGWYRCVLTVVSGTASVNITVARTNTTTIGNYGLVSYAGTGTSVYIWGAQLEQRSSVTSYTATTTAAITNYIPVLQTGAINQARFDHNPTTGESLGLLIEEQRTNLLTYSDDFSNAVWTKATATISSNTVVAPDGTLTGDKFIGDSGQALLAPAAYQTITKSAVATSYTYTLFAKQAGYNRIQVFVRDSSTSANNALFAVSLVDGTITSSASVAGTFTSVSASVSSVGNGWYRCSLSFTSGTETNIRLYAQNSDSTATTCNGFSGIYIWGAQLEAGSFATSYIPTVASQVTRSADSASMTGTNFSSWYNAGEGTVYAEINPLALATSSGVTINDNTTSNRIRVTTNSTTDQSLITTSGTAQATLDGGTPVANTAMKLATSYKTNDFALSLNGGTVATDTSGSIPVVTQLQIGAETTTIGTLTLKKVAYYPIRVSNANLIALTGS